MSVKRFDGTQWVYVGSRGFGVGEGSYPDIAFDPATDLPYVSYVDWDHSGGVTVMRFDGTNWLTVGTAGFTPDTCNGFFPKLAFQPGTNILNLAFCDIGNGYLPSVMNYTSGAWNYVGPPGIGSVYAYEGFLAFHPTTHEPYFAYVNGEDAGTVEVIRFDGLNWVSVGSTNRISSTAFTLYREPLTFFFNPLTNEPYVAFAEGSHDAISVIRYDGSSWVNVGNPQFASYVGDNISLSFNPVTNEPYVAFTYYNPTSVGSPYFIGDPKNDKVSVMKFDGTSWSFVSNPYFGRHAYYSLLNFTPGTNHLTVTYFEQTSLTPSGIGMTTMEYTDPVNGACGSSNGGTFPSAPSSGLCDAGVAGTVSGSGPWTWYCAGVGGSTASCSANHTPINGVCGSSHGGTFSSAPNTNLCSVGNASSVNGTGPWDWTCAGQYGGSIASCDADPSFPVNGVCGSSHGGTFSSAPNTNLCSVGNASSVNGTGPWNWTCSGYSGGSAASCGADIQPSANGACGSAAQNYSSAATDFSGSFCSSGTANPSSPVFPAVNATTSWTCEGTSGGTNANCSATHQSSICTQNSLSCGVALNSAVDTGDCASSPRGVGYHAEIASYNASMGETVQVTAHWDGFDGYLYLTDENNIVLAENDDYGGTDRSSITFVFPATGIYHLWMTTYALGNSGGTYSVNLQKSQSNQVWRDDFDDDSTGEYAGDYYGWGAPFNTATESDGTMRLSNPTPYISWDGNNEAVDFWFDTGMPDGYFPAGSIVTARIRVNSDREQDTWDDYMFSDDWQWYSGPFWQNNQWMNVSFSVDDPFSKIGFEIAWKTGTWNSVADSFEVDWVKIDETSPGSCPADNGGGGGGNGGGGGTNPDGSKYFYNYHPVTLDINSTIALSCDTSVSMNALVGTGKSNITLTGNKATNNMVMCNINTNNASGYKIEWNSSSTLEGSGAMKSTTNASDTISPYSLSASSETWSVAPTASEWGAKLGASSEGYGTGDAGGDYSYASAGGWGTNDGYTGGGKWMNVPTSPFQIMQKSTETDESGEYQYLVFGAEIGADKLQPTGTYTQEVTVTATTL